MQVKPKRINDPKNPGKKIDDYWGPAQSMLADSTFLLSLKGFDKDHIDPKIIDKIRVFLLNPDFSPEVVKKASKAAFGLCCWVRAMESYDRVAKVPQIQTSHVLTSVKSCNNNLILIIYKVGRNIAVEFPCLLQNGTVNYSSIINMRSNAAIDGCIPT